MIHRNAVKELNLVISVIHKVWIEDRIKRRSSEHTIRLEIESRSTCGDVVRFRIHPLLLRDKCLSISPYYNGHVIHRTMHFYEVAAYSILHSWFIHWNSVPTRVHRVIEQYTCRQ